MTKSAKSPKPKATKTSKSNVKADKPSKPSKSTTGGKESKKDAIFKHICEQHVMGITEVAKLDIALAIGFKNPRSEGFSKPLKELTTDGLVTKGSKKDSLSLTDKGMESMPEDLDPSSKDPSQVHDHYIEFIEKKAKGGVDKVRPLYEMLLNFEAHSVADLAKELGYGNPRSFSNTKIIPAMKDMGLVEDAGKGKIQFTDKVPK